MGWITTLLAIIFSTSVLIVLAKYSAGLKVILKALLYSFILAIVVYWLFEGLGAVLPVWIVPLIMLLAVVINIYYHKTNDDEESD